MHRTIVCCLDMLSKLEFLQLIVKLKWGSCQGLEWVRLNCSLVIGLWKEPRREARIGKSSGHSFIAQSQLRSAPAEGLRSYSTLCHI